MSLRVRRTLLLRSLIARPVRVLISSVVVTCFFSWFLLSTPGHGERLASKQHIITPAQYYPPVESPALLAVVTLGGGNLERSTASATFLRVILGNFVATCEAGMNVNVVLVNYENFDKTPLSFKPGRISNELFCHRKHRYLNITTSFYPNRRLPPHAFGTAGDLQIRHREIFLRERENYDYFLSQEDDVSVSQRTIRYFAEHMSQFEEKSFNRLGNFFPSFYSYERLNQVNFLDWRLRAGKIIQISGQYFFEHSILDTPASGARAYMVSRKILDTLPNILDVSRWLDPTEVKGEFNPLVGSALFLTEAYRVVIPLEDWREAAVHHLPNKYLEMMQAEGIRNPKFVPIEETDLAFIFSSCLSEETASASDTDDVAHAITSEGSCRACFEDAGYASFETVPIVSNKTLNPDHRSLHVTFSCEKTPWFKFDRSFINAKVRIRLLAFLKSQAAVATT